ncbi:MAG: endonuclease/exonuclease/phosphatase family protein [Bacteroidetes bacterium]|nr:endonuclease/exonuclease/phosphatase family protein [Bacteroidota bacterium]
MKKVFSVVSWNVEHFRKPTNASSKAEWELFEKRMNRVSDLINSKKPDIIGLYEVEGSDFYKVLLDKFPNYQFHITEGPQTQEILIGVKSSFSAFFTQKVEFKSGGSYLRPGALLSLKIDDENYTLMFLHTKSGNDPKGFGLRDDMLARALKFRKVLNKVSPSSEGANYIFLGDLNTMGMDYPYDKKVPASLEIKRIKRRAAYYKMKQLVKDYPFTFSNGSQSSYPQSDLDHVFASKHLEFKTFPLNYEINLINADVQVIGWPQAETLDEQDKWINEYSDHAMLYFEVIRK